MRPDKAVDGPGGEGIDGTFGGYGIGPAPAVGVDACAGGVGLLEDGVEEGRDVGAPGHEAIGSFVRLEEDPCAGGNAAETALLAAGAVAQDASRHVRAVAAPIFAVAYPIDVVGPQHGLPRLWGDAHYASAQAGVEGLGARLPQIAGDARGEAAVEDRDDLPRAGESHGIAALHGVHAEETLRACHIVAEAGLIRHVRAKDAAFLRERRGQRFGGGLRLKGRPHAHAAQSRL